MTSGDDFIRIPAIGPTGTLVPAPKLEVHRTGALHLAVSIFVFHGRELLIQKRAAGKYRSAGLWANTCCTHPNWGESPADCAVRRLTEETGLALELGARGVVDYRAEVGGGLVENERVHVFQGSVAGKPARIDFDPDEVAEVRWVDLDRLRDEVRDRPKRFSAWLAIYLERWPELALAA